MAFSERTDERCEEYPNVNVILWLLTQKKFKSSFLGPEIISNKLFIHGCSYFISPMGTFPVALVTWTVPPTFWVILPSNPLLLEMLVKHKPNHVTYFSFWIFNDIPSLILKFKGFLKGWSKPFFPVPCPSIFLSCPLIGKDYTLFPFFCNVSPSWDL